MKENYSAKDARFDILDALQSPILTHCKSWIDCVPKRMFDIIPLARMKSLMQHEELATYAECVIFLMTRSMEAPMDYEWTDIYTHVSCVVLKEYFNEDRFDDVRAPKELSQWLRSQLLGLQRHIYSKRRDILKKRLNESKRKEREEAKATV